MSSHHFVREGQEPAVLIAEAVDFEQVGSMLEWAPLIMVHENALSNALQWGIKIDVVLADESRVRELTSELLHQAPIRIISAGSNYLETAMAYLSRLGQMAVNVACQDQQNVLAQMVSIPEGIDVSVLSTGMRTVHIASGKLTKWYPANTRIIIAHDTLPLKMTGLIKDKTHFTTSQDGLVTVESDAPFWLGEPL